ncbi:hypothetical protein POM88_014641 [Heracleum sosnowskyi]|uniref:Uncharacterized protein n=1 Tax=Heracleum sosnowskyi TaxID=360622 RepID=A0AAD8MR51_9APIA|nr:hypothetical protein POM88_014592 [Heracleum sosnowskyi]KAK1386430.1 hypothetical protein POM88_014608 [Heracleum sosnowskyi]KAK1386445.1 hypothetical protein POM88_014623 [Heracleum sosnowskyi]KAK1386446.1 hypothetical protein POM88_014624 [Heracleum sosnowskyi]KAK1386463.1 hypothetical protein POM88_014641 [Heracleum sosnowskyi]
MRLLFARREYIEAAIAKEQEKVGQMDAEQKNTIAAQFDVVMPRLVVAPFLEVGNVEDAEYLVDLRATHGWEGVACMDDDFIPIEAVGSIVQTLEAGLVPIRYFHRDEVGYPVFD